MLVLLAGIFVVHIATVVMLFVSTIANVWIVTTISGKTNSSGLWKQCSESNCVDLSVPNDDLGNILFIFIYGYCRIDILLYIELLHSFISFLPCVFSCPQGCAGLHDPGHHLFLHLFGHVCGTTLHHGEGETLLHHWIHYADLLAVYFDCCLDLYGPIFSLLQRRSPRIFLYTCLDLLLL
uniref:Uncharacterized protein n=1 Tax=Pseudonaja textilis TaxID=8673 RepID=A0A670XWN9_PSETE